MDRTESCRDTHAVRMNRTCAITSLPSVSGYRITTELREAQGRSYHRGLSMASIRRWFFLLLMTLLLPTAALADDRSSILSPRNREAPFCYLRGGERAWPIMLRNLPESHAVQLIARNGTTLLEKGHPLRLDGVTVEITAEGKLSVIAEPDARLECDLEIVILQGTEVLESQIVSVRPAPPHRPISYVADLVDDLIRIYWDSNAREFQPLTKDGLDQYFRRLQFQGVSRLIVWQSPFPLITDPKNYFAEDWTRTMKQAQAIIESEELTAAMPRSSEPKSYQWLQMLISARSTPEFGRLLTQSATEHGIRLTASFRPFEPALTKYYDIPVFDEDGTYLWNFRPTASPAVDQHVEEVGFANGREILRQMDRSDEAEPERILIRCGSEAVRLHTLLERGELKLEILESPFPPLDETSFVLVRDATGKFSLQRFAAVSEQAYSRLSSLQNVRFWTKDGVFSFHDVSVSPDTRYLIFRFSGEQAREFTLPAELDIEVRAKGRNSLDRVNTWCALKGDDDVARSTRVAGIPENGLYRTGFQAIESSIDAFRHSDKEDWTLSEGNLVIDLGDRWSVEMVDFERPAAREYVVKELRTVLNTSAFDEIFINTRSHTQLASSTADGSDGVQPMAHYRLHGKNYHHNGIDRAFGPISMATDPAVLSLPAEQITSWQPDEWQGPCQSDTSPFQWRYRRNVAIARGLRKLLQDLEREFPRTRIRVVIPHNESVIRETQASLDDISKPGGGTYGRDYFRHIWGSLNYIPSIGEGMAMVDLSGLTVEPVYLGVRFLPDDGPLQSFVDLYTQQLATNFGSNYRGPRSFFYEAQETLRASAPAHAQKRREKIICELLSRRADIDEVILYEAADWTYYLPAPPAGAFHYGYIDACTDK